MASIRHFIVLFALFEFMSETQMPGLELQIRVSVKWMNDNLRTERKKGLDFQKHRDQWHPPGSLPATTRQVMSLLPSAPWVTSLLLTAKHYP